MGLHDDGAQGRNNSLAPNKALDPKLDPTCPVESHGFLATKSNCPNPGLKESCNEHALCLRDEWRCRTR